MRRALPLILATLLAAVPLAAAQLPLDPLSKPAPAADPFTNPGLTPEAAFLYGLEAKFARDTAQGGGAAFAKWFAPDAVTLSNGKEPVIGQAAIAASANWTAAQYQLTWTPEGARMGPSGDMGFTWGSYEGRAKDRDGSPIVTTGRYMTVWKKQLDGSWKVELDASNDAPPVKQDCCKLP
ncbi:MAG: nuclear transport factor 2 family protein [Acidobacteriaceae bacterium]